jgi:hypothetical protein
MQQLSHWIIGTDTVFYRVGNKKPAQKNPPNKTQKNPPKNPKKTHLKAGFIGFF